MSLWTFDAIEEPDGWRWLLSEGPAARSVSAALFDDREEALDAATRFADAADRLTWSVAPDMLHWWFWLAMAPDGIVCCSGPCRGVEQAQEEGERARRGVAGAVLLSRSDRA